MPIITKDGNIDLLQENSSPLQDFIESAKSIKWAGFARQNRYSVDVYYPPVVSAKLNERDKKFVNLMCEQAVFPGKNINLSRISFNGLEETRAKSIDYIGNSVIMTFLVDRNYYVKNVFDIWMNQVVAPPTKNNNIISGGLDYGSFGSGKVVNYFDEYVGTIKIGGLLKSHFQGSNNRPFLIKLNDVYPTGISPIKFASNSQNYIRIAVSFAFTSWETEKQEILSPDRGVELQFAVKVTIPDFFKKRPALILKIIGGDALTLLRQKVFISNPKLARILRKVDSIPFAPFRRITRRF